MSEIRPRHRISLKAAIYSPDGQQVLVMKYYKFAPVGYGLPGGHLEEGEALEAALRRELLEEVGAIDIPTLTRRDFWWHEGGKLILGFTGRMATFDLPQPPNPQKEVAQWVTLKDIESHQVPTGSYGDFILEWQEIAK